MENEIAKKWLLERAENREKKQQQQREMVSSWLKENAEKAQKRKTAELSSWDADYKNLLNSFDKRIGGASNITYGTTARANDTSDRESAITAGRLKSTVEKYRDSFEGDADSIIDQLTSIEKGYEGLLQNSEFYSQFKDEDDFKRYDAGWLADDAVVDTDTVEKRRAIYEENKKYLEENDVGQWDNILSNIDTQIRTLESEGNRYRSRTTGELPADVQEKISALEAQRAEIEKKYEAQAEYERREAENRQYERTQKVVDDYYDVRDREGFGSAARDYGNPTREELENSAVSADPLQWTNDGMGNFYDSFGNPVDIENPPSALGVTDRLGLYLSASKDERNNAWGPALSDNAWSKVLQEGQKGDWDQLDDTEIDIYYQLMQDDGVEAANKFLDDMTVELNRRATLEMEASVQDADALELILLNAASIPLNVLGAPLGFIDDTVEKLTGKEINPYSGLNQIGYYAQAIRGESASRIDEATGGIAVPWVDFSVGDAYQALMSGVDSLAGSVLGGTPYGILMGMGAAQSKARELYERGASEGEIVVGGLLSGAAEMIFEKFSIDQFVKMGDSKTIKTLALNALKQGGIEASEETLTEMANIAADTIMMKSQSEWRKNIDRYKEQGYSEAEASAMALADEAKQLGSAALGGLISGGAMAGLSGTANYAANKVDQRNRQRNIGKSVIDNGEIPELMQLARSLAYAEDADTGAGNLTNRQLDRLARKAEINPNARNVGRVMHEVQAREAGSVKADIRDSLIDSGMSRGEAESAASDAVGYMQGDDSKAEAFFKLQNTESGRKAIDFAAGQNEEMVETVSEADLPDALVRRSRKQNLPRVELSEEAKKSGVYGERIAEDEVSRSEAKKPEAAPKIKISEGGETVLNSTGESVKVKEISSIKDGKITLTLEDGQKVDSSEISLGGDDAVIYETVAKMDVDAETANVIIRGFDAADGVSAETYALGAAEAYRYGRYGIPASEMSKDGFSEDLTPDQRSLAYELGRIGNKYAERRRAQIDKAKENRKNQPKREAKKRGVKYDGVDLRGRKLNDRQRTGVKVAEVLADAGLDVHIYESTASGSGTRTMSDGKAAPNGWYDHRDGSIHIDLASGNHGEGTMLYSLSHELAHFINDWSPSKFKILSDYLFESYAESGTDAYALIEQKMDELSRLDKYADLSDTKLRDIAWEEVVADSMESMLTREDVVEQLSGLKKADSTLWEKIKKFFTDLAAKIKAAYENMSPNTAEGQAVAQMAERADEIARLFSEGVTEAVRTYDEAGGMIIREGGEEIRYSTYPFGDQIDDVINGRHNPRFDLFVSDTPDSLLAVNFPDVPLLMRNGKVGAILSNHVEMNAELLKEIPSAIADPVLILKSRSHPNESVVVVTDITVSGRQMIVPVWVNRMGTYLDVDLTPVTGTANLVASAYGKEIKSFLKYASENDGFIYQCEDINRVRQLFARNGLQLPGPLKLSDSNISVSQNSDDVNTSIRKNTESDTDSLPRYSLRNSDSYSSRRYDYSKSFSEQIEDYINGELPEYDTLTVSGTPQVYREIGLSPLPMTYTQKHLRENLYGDADHRISRENLDKLPEALENPIAIIASSTKKGRIVSIVDITASNGRNILAAVEIGGYGTMNKERIDSNAIVSIYSKGNGAERLLEKALVDEAGGLNTVFYIQREKAAGLLKSRVQFPGSMSFANGFVHSISENPDFVNVQIKNQTETRQFKRWFGESKVVDEDGAPRVMVKTKAEGGLDKIGMAFSGAQTTSVQKSGDICYLRIENPASKSEALRALNVYAGQENAVKKARSLLKKHGHDGVIIDDGTYIAFSSEQIKSATDNIGAFDGSNPDIRYSLRSSDSYSSRSILADVLEDTVTDPDEYLKLREFRENITRLDIADRELSRKRKQLRDLYRSDERATPEGRAKIEKLQNETLKLRELLNKYDRNLLELESTTALKNLLARERAGLNKRWRSKMTEFKKDQWDRAAKSETRNKIRRLISRMNSRLTNPSQSRYVPKELVTSVTRVLSNITTSTRGGAAEQFNDLLLRYRELEGDPQYHGVYDKAVEAMISDLQKSLKDVPLAEMTRAQLDSAYSAMKVIEHKVVEANRVVIRDQEYRASDMAAEMTRETREAKHMNEGALGKWITAQTRPETMFERFGGFKKNSTWSTAYRILEEGQLKKLRVIQEGNEMFKELTKNDEELSKLTSTKEKNLVDLDLVDENGNKVPITRGMMLSIYMHLQNESNWRHVTGGGFTIPVMKEYYKGNSEKAWGRGAVKVTLNQEMGKTRQEISDLERELERRLERQKKSTDPEISAKEAAAVEKLKQRIDELEARVRDQYASAYNFADMLAERIEKKLTDYEKQWIVKAKEFFDEYSKDRLNETTMELYGFEKARVNNYYPIHTDANYRQASFESIIRDMSLENMGFMKERIKSGSPILLEDITEVISRQIDRVAMYCGMTGAIKDFQKVYGKMSAGYTDSLQKAMNDTFGVGAKKYIENLMSDLVGARRGESSMWDRARGHTAQAALSLNLRVALAQTASFPTAAAEIGWKPLAQALAKGGKNSHPFSSADRELIAKWSPLLWYRMNGGSTTELADIKTMNKLENRAMKKLRFAMNWIEAMDAATVGRLWYAAEYYVQDNNKALKKGTREYYEEVAKVFNRVVEKTQPNYTELQRPDILRNPNAVVKQLTMFMTQRLQNANILYESVGRYQKYSSDLKNGKNGVTKADVKEARLGVARAVTSQLVAAAMIVGFKGLADIIMHSVSSYRDDDDELTAASVGITLAENFAETLMSSFLAGSEICSLIKSLIMNERYYGISVQGIDAFSSSLESFVSLVSNAKKGSLSKEDFFSLAENACTFLGIPASGAFKIVKGMWYWIEDIKNGEVGSFEAGVDRTSKQNARRLYRARMNGDTEAEKDISGTFADSKKAASALRDQLRENDGRIRDAALERRAGNLSEYKRIAKEIIGEGHFTQDEVVAAINSEMTYFSGKVKNIAKLEEGSEEYKKGVNELKKRGYSADVIGDAVGKKVSEDDGEETEEESLAPEAMYKSSDMIAAFESGNKEDGKEAIDEIIENKMASGKTKKEAVSSVKSSLNSYYKDKYIEAYLAKDEEEMKRIRYLLKDTGLYTSGYGKTAVEVCRDWIKSYAKERREKK